MYKPAWQINSEISRYEGWLTDHILYRMVYPYTGNREIDKVIQTVLGYYIRVRLSPRRAPPTAAEYIACLSPDFGHGLLVKARELGYLPKYNAKKAAKWGIEPRKSYPDP